MFAIILGDGDKDPRTQRSHSKLALVLHNYEDPQYTVKALEPNFDIVEIDCPRTATTDPLAYPKPEDLVYGDCILWRNPEEIFGRRFGIGENIRHFTKENKLYETMDSNEIKQILLTGVMTPNRKFFRLLEWFPSLDIPEKMSHLVFPNVAVRAWVRLEYSRESGLKYELMEFFGVDESYQHSIRKRDFTTLYQDYDVKGHIFQSKNGILPISDRKQEVKYVKAPNPSLPHVRGVVASETCVISPDYPNLYFRRIAMGEGSIKKWPAVGTHVFFIAEFLKFVDIYAIIDFKSKCDHEKPIPTTANGNLKTTVRYNEDAPGYFKSEHLNCHVDDPLNLLEALPFSRYSGSTISVGIRDGMPSMSGKPRYYIAEIADKKEDKLEEFKKSGEMKIEDEQAVVYDQYGRLYLSKWPNLKLRLNKRCFRLYRIGSIVRVSADYNWEEKRWVIRKLRRDPELKRLRTVARFDPLVAKTRIFFFLPSVKGRDDFPFMLTHPIFRMIRTPISFKPVVDAKFHTFKNIWITLSYPNPGENMVPPCKFLYCGTGKVLPVTKTQPALEFDYIVSDEDYNLDSYYPEDEVPEIIEDIEQLKEDTLLREEWINSATEAVREDFMEHEKHCDKCRERDETVRCYFTDFLHDTIIANDDLSDPINELGLLKTVIRRSFLD